MNDTIERCTPAHIPALRAIHAASFPPKEAWSEDAFALQLALTGVFGLIDRRGGMLLVRLAGDEAEILTLAVSPAARRQGVATALLRAAKAEVGACQGVALFLEVGVGNAAARALYEREGFVEVGRRPGYYSDGSDALVLRVTIG